MATLNSLTIAGIDRKGLVDQASLTYDDELNARDTMEFTLIDPTGAARPAVGQPVVLTVDSVLKFAGTIDSFSERNLKNVASGAQFEYRVQCVDNNQLADRHLVAEVYENQTMKQIVQDILADHLASEGVTLDPAFPTGPTIEHLPFNYVSAARAFDELSELTGYFWIIDPNKVLKFIDRTTMVAPAVLDQSAGTDLAYSLDIEKTREQYRNQQFIRGGLTITDVALVERQFGDGELRTFVTALPVALTPIVRTDIGSGFVVRTVGIRQVETGKDWYWQEGSNEISQDSGGTVLGATHRIEIEYRGYFPFITAARDQAGVTDRIAVEGGSGLYEHLEDHEEITKAELGRDKAEGLLKRFGTIETRLTFRSRVAGWQAGQLLTVSRAEHGLSGTFLISAVRFEHVVLDEFHYVITAVAGDAVESWVMFFKRLAEAGRRIVRRPNEVINLLRFFPEDLTVSESFPAPVTNTAAIGIVRADGETQTERHKVGFAKVG